MLQHYPSSSFTRNSEGLQRFIPPLSDSPPKSKHFHSPYHLRPSIQISPQNYRSIGEISNPSIFHPSPRSIDQSLNISMRKDTSLERGVSNPLVDKLALKNIVNSIPLSESSYHLPLNYSSPRTQTRLPTFHSPSSNGPIMRRNTSKLLTYSPKPPPLMDHESSGYIRSPPTMKESPYGFGIEAQFEKQNRVLTQILGMVAKQKEIEEEQRQKYDIREKTQEFVEYDKYDKIKTELELEKQKSRSQIATGTPTPKKLSPKKDPSKIEKVMLGLVLKKAASKLKIEDEKEEETIMEKSLPVIKEKSYQELETPKRPQISRRKRIVSPGGTIYKEMTSPLLPKSMKSLNAFEEEGSFNGGNNKSMVMPVSLSRFKSTKESSSVAKSQVINESRSIILETEQPEQEEKEEKEEKIIVERSKRRRRTTRREKTRKEEGPIFAASLASLGNISRKEEKKAAKAKKYGKLACFGWALVYGRVLFAERKKRKMEEKTKFEEDISSKIGQIYELSKIWIEENAGKEILTMLKDAGQNFCIANIEGKPQVKRTEKICLTLMGHFKVIFNKLYMAMEKIPEALVEVLSPLVKDESFLQNDYFSGFEIKRMKFGPFGSIKEMSPQRVKMIVGGIIIMRVLIYNFIMRPWEVYKQQEKSKFKIDKLLNIGSILYNTMMGIFKLSVPAYEKNQSFLSEELRIKPKRNILQAIDDGGSENNIYGVEKDTSRDGEILGGFYAGHQLSSWFVENKKITEELKQLMMGWLDAVYKKVQ